SSPFRFGFLRTFERTGPPNNAETPHSELRYTREFVGGTTTSISWEDFWQTDAYHQMAVIADRAGEDNHFRYKLNWITNGTYGNPPTGAQNNPTFPTATEIQLSGLQVGDSVLIGLERYATSSLTLFLSTGIDPFGTPEFGGPGTSVTSGNPSQLPPGSPT